MYKRSGRRTDLHLLKDLDKDEENLILKYYEAHIEKFKGKHKDHVYETYRPKDYFLHEQVIYLSN